MTSSLAFFDFIIYIRGRILAKLQVSHKDHRIQSNDQFFSRLSDANCLSKSTFAYFEF